MIYVWSASVAFSEQEHPWPAGPFSLPAAGSCSRILSQTGELQMVVVDAGCNVGRMSLSLGARFSGAAFHLNR
jgi:hypothetical protein